MKVTRCDNCGSEDYGFRWLKLQMPAPHVPNVAPGTKTLDVCSIECGIAALEREKEEK